MTTPTDVTLVKGAIHNPNEARHFMRVVPTRTRQVATLDGQVVADSTDAVVVTAWSDVEMVAGEELRDLVAFEPSKVRVSESGREQ